jgi:transcriptional regulator with XRE-family HTH domain
MHTPLTLRQLRLSKGLTQDVIGNRKDVGEIEKGRKMPGPRLVRRMAKALGVSTEIVFDACTQSRRVSEATTEAISEQRAAGTHGPHGPGDVRGGAASW